MDVGGWLRSLGLGEYEAKFRDNKIEADVLPDLTADDLKDIGVSAVGDRRRLLAAIAALTCATPPANAPATLLKFESSEAPEVLAERRPLTVMFCDLVGSTALASRLDAEDWRSLVNPYLDEASAAVTGLGGHVLKRLGDGLMALFGYPIAQENDAERAVRAALAIQRALAERNARSADDGVPELAARIGLDSGLVVVDATGEVFGEAPHVAARVQALAEPGAVILTGAVQRQTAGLFVAEDRGTHELKGVPAPVRLYRIVRASGGRRRGARAITPLVGRAEELDLLRRRWERVRGGEGQLALIVGEPGLGKSRLIEEFRGRLGETPHTWVGWSASQLLQNTPLHPVAEWGRLRFANAPAEQRLADLEHTLRTIGLDPAEYAPLLAPLADIPLPPGRAANMSSEELRRRQLAAITAWVLAGARSQAVALAFEDLHWADPTSLDLLQTLAEVGAKAPLLILATTRPEFRPPWSLRSHHSVISLSPLARAEVAEMVGELAQRHALSEEMVDGVNERTGGVPLFVEEVTRLLLERGEEGGANAIPPTLQQSLAARLDRLGEAREAAQIGSVLGRSFSYALLRDVAGLAEASLQTSLDRLADAKLLFVEGAPPLATYRFKHALIQDAAYESLLKSRRQPLHHRAAETLREAGAEPEAIAHHFTEAGLDDLAIEWWGKAGEQALRRSAFKEAIAHLGKAIAMADKPGAASTPRAVASTTADSERLKLQTSLGQAMMFSRGYASDESKAAFSRARALAAGVGDASERFDAYFGLFIGSVMRGELGLALETAESFLREAENAGRMTETVAARACLGRARLWQGDLIGAEANLVEAVRTYDPERDRDAEFRFGVDIAATATGFLALAAWALGDVERARALSEGAVARADETAHAPTRAVVYDGISLYQTLCGDPEAVSRTAKIAVDLGREHGMAMYLAWGEVLSHWARARLGDRESGMIGLQEALAAYLSQGNKLFTPLFQGLLAELEAEGNDADGALRRIDEALALASETGERWTDAQLHRIRGAIVLRRDPANTAPAEEAFLAAIAIAQAQKARSFELRASLSLAKLHQSTARPADAHAVLAPALEGFSPTPEMPEIAEAQALLAALAETEEVKADAAHRQRRLHLQTAYGNALIAERGHGAPETTEAFARAREASFGDKDAPERLAADYGLWVGSLVRGELSPMRTHAETLLSDVEARPDSPEAGAAHRAAGITHWFAGEYVGAREHLERALALFRPGRDDDLAFRFGQDQGVAAMLYLALTLWPLGDINRAVSLVRDAEARIAGHAHISTRAYGKCHVALVELMRGDLSRAARNAVELAELTRDHNLLMWQAVGVFLEGVAKAESSELIGGLADMRRGVKLLREQNLLVFDGLFMIALADVEARAGDVEHALTILDEALATCERAGHRAFEAELHRVRGEMLLKRDRANTAAAGEAFQTAIAIARRQGTLSFELRAALSLAKFCQSTGRLVDAHAVLSPALEGFTPTAEMPEIAEAQALLAALAETEEVKAALAQRQRRLHLQPAYGQALQLGKGFAAEETRAAFARVSEFARPNENPAARFAAHYARCIGSFFRGEFSAAQEMAETFLREAEAEGRATEAGTARRQLGLVLFFMGELKAAQSLLERASADSVPDRDGDARRIDGQSSATAILASAVWHLGEVDRARLLIQQALRRARELGHAATTALVLNWNAYLEIRRDDVGAARLAADASIKLADEHGMNLFAGNGQVCAYWARGRLVDPEEGASGLRQALQALLAEGNRADAPFFHGMLAELEAAARGPDSALTTIDQGLTIAEETGGRFMEPYLHRLRGDILLKRDPADSAPAEDAYRTAIAVARQQGARSYELLASLSLARLYQSTSRNADAHAVLTPAVEGFSPTPEMPEIAEAQTVLAALEETEEVKAEAAQRHRRLHLQTAYGNALFAARGYGASETTEAFARAREAAFGDRDAPERLVADAGLWLGSLVRGELSLMRTHAEAFLCDVEARPDSPEAGIGRGISGTMHWFAGEYREARDHLEHAVAMFQPGRDDDLAFRFGQDPSVAAMLYLALTLWPLGDIERAISLVGEAEARIAGLAHIGTRAFERMHAALFALMRGDLSRAAQNAIELAQLTREHDLPMWRAFGAFLEGFATAQSGPAGTRLAEMRGGAELLREQNTLIFDGLLMIPLAEAEGRAGDVERALATLDEALATCERTGHRAFEAELHRVRGEMLLKRDPTNPAAAGEAFLAAIAIARRQATRSFGLRAALALAKLYQSTGRLPDAHAVLAPAVEGFSPTPEMPEIAEAHTLLAALAEMDQVKTDKAERQQRLRLHVSYSNALHAARGPGALETIEAFTRAREQAGGDNATPERLAVDYGLYVSAFVRGELPSMRAHAAAVLADVETRAVPAEVGVAHRVQGVTHWFTGEFLEAEQHLECAVALFQLRRDDDLSFLLVQDAGATAMAYLALASWPLGQIERAVSLVERMRARIGGLTQPDILAFGAMHAALFALMSGDHLRVQTNMSDLVGIVGEHDLGSFRAFGVFFEGWATVDAGALADGLERMRRGVEDLRAQNLLTFDGLVKIALAEAEAGAGDVDRAVALLDEALATSERISHRTFEAELHRSRGEMLLKRDRANTASAEQALRRAIAVAHEQGTRSFGLRAALALAKLYQSTGRLVDAHAVLSPALEGFTPTAGMPEIAEAQALMKLLGGAARGGNERSASASAQGAAGGADAACRRLHRSARHRRRGPVHPRVRARP